MHKVRRIAAAAGAALALTLGAGSAAQATAARPYDYVTVSTDGGVIRVSTQMPGQPLWSASADTNTGKVCTGFSYQIPFCVTLPVRPALSGLDSTLPVGVTVDADSSDGSVGVYTTFDGLPLLGVRYSTASGQLCAGFSYQVPVCVGGN